MVKKHICFDIEDLEIRVAILKALSLALSEAIMNGNHIASTYEWGFYEINNLLDSLLQDVVKLRNKSFEELKSIKESEAK